ncbi:MAG: response regulator [Candidatus Zixiibacteriota bacterium]
MTPPTLDAPSVLVVENNPEVLNLIVSMVAAQGWKPLPARSLAEARRSIAAETVNAVISDVELDDGDGITLVREMRRSAATPVPTVMMSSYASPEVRLMAQRAGAVELLPKPFRLEQLSSILSRELQASVAPESR